MAEMTPIALTIAGSDSGGGAGIQADIKTFSALGVYGCSVITALTAQNTRGVRGVFGVDPGFVRAQMDAVFDDISVSAVKIGMLGTAAIIRAVAEGLERWQPRWIVLDPVMVAKGGDRLLDVDALTALRERLIPLASLITPNLPEAADILGSPMAEDLDSMVSTARALQNLGARAVLLKGGHLGGNASPDFFAWDAEEQWLESRRHATQNTHGTGCTLSSAITASLALGMPLDAAVSKAKQYIDAAIAAADSLRIGHGHGPVHHFFKQWSS
ncbi:MAG TPA: bifunctional hydroxymethylpyrimidine kinase/phosphomethylpyrimidine kinase [Polyangiaceae bacterium]|jgi:hydroxymethylpyrimidine/phosphomethylpyrimidine kinase|nr:bifunctional hydroxymethylpyrimidine kinase/phosphomethylpyrimidine kinase [Polyangiaceae bacterium]